MVREDLQENPCCVVSKNNTRKFVSFVYADLRGEWARTKSGLWRGYLAVQTSSLIEVSITD